MRPLHASRSYESRTRSHDNRTKIVRYAGLPLRPLHASSSYENRTISYDNHTKIVRLFSPCTPCTLPGHMKVVRYRTKIVRTSYGWLSVDPMRIIEREIQSKYQRGSQEALRAEASPKISDIIPRIYLSRSGSSHAIRKSYDIVRKSYENRTICGIKCPSPARLQFIRKSYDIVR